MTKCSIDLIDCPEDIIGTYSTVVLYAVVLSSHVTVCLHLQWLSALHAQEEPALKAQSKSHADEGWPGLVHVTRGLVLRSESLR